MTPEQTITLEELIDAGNKIAVGTPAWHGYLAIKAMYEENTALRADNKRQDEEIGRLETERRNSIDDFNMSQTHCRAQSREINSLNLELSKAHMECARLRKELKHHQAYTGSV